MPYIIAIVIIIVAAGALFLFRESAEAPTTPEPDMRAEDAGTQLPEGYTPPSEQPPSLNPGGEAAEDGAVEDEEFEDPTIGNNPPTPQAVEAEPAGATGTFTAASSYSTGRSIHELDVTLTLDNGVVTAADIDYDGAGEPGTPILRSFNEAYETEVVGRDIDSIELSRVGGASWTSNAFNEAVDEIRAQL